MPRMLVTLDTSHFDMSLSPLKDFADENRAIMLVTLDTSHFERSLSNDIAC